MKIVIICRNVNGLEMYQVYNENGYQGQRWSRAYAEVLANQLLTRGDK